MRLFPFALVLAVALAAVIVSAPRAEAAPVTVPVAPAFHPDVYVGFGFGGGCQPCPPCAPQTPCAAPYPYYRPYYYNAPYYCRPYYYYPRTYYRPSAYLGFGYGRQYYGTRGYVRGGTVHYRGAR